MIIFSGKGGLTFLILILGVMITQSVYEAASGLKLAEQDADLMWACSLLMGSIGNFFFVKYLNRKPKRVVIDKETGEELILNGNGSLFLIPIEKWTAIYAVISLILWLRFFLGWE